MINRIKKILSVITVIALLFTNTGLVFAQSIPTPPPAPTMPYVPTAPPAPTMPPVPTAPPAPTIAPTNAPTPPPVPTAPPAPTIAPTITPTPVQTSVPIIEPILQPTATPLVLSQFVDTENLGGQEADGGTGSNSINTGNATNDGLIVNDLNSNLSAVLSDGTGNGSAEITNTGNGAGSTNSGSAVVVNNTNTDQSNLVVLENGLYQSAVTGDNSASKNTGGDSAITTGDANVTGTILNSVNTNVAGVLVSEFNVMNDTTGDIILDFVNNCITNCGTPSNTTIKNSGNGADSTNTGSLDVVNNNSTNQLNDAVIANEMDLFANSGNNVADKNTGGDSTIVTGDANVAANLLTFANNNIAGNVIYSVVNIFGDLIGDIILPEELLAGCCGTNPVTLANLNNGADSNNVTNYSNEITDSLTQINNLEIENNLIFDAATGQNDTYANTGGDSSIITGDTSVNAKVLNVANNNISGENMWLVIVNQAGRWIGKILGTADGTNIAGSEGFEFEVDENGGVTVANAGNGAGSTNTATYNETNNNDTTQVNNAKIVNNLDLAANTGGNSASKNTNGDSSVTTGDANIIANIVNFVNNNITGSGKLVVTVVNVFGSWLGDFVGPGFTKEVQSNESPSNTAIGGSDMHVNTNSQTDNNEKTSGSSNSVVGNNSVVKLVSPVAFIPKTKVLGAKISVVDGNQLANNTEIDSDKKKVININFAWVLAALFPIGIVSIILRRRSHA